MITESKYKTKIGTIKTYRHAKIVHGYRENGKIKWKLIKNIGSIKTKEDEKKAKETMEKLKEGKKLLTLEEFSKNKKTFEYGVVYVCEQLWKRIELNQIMHECTENTKTKFNFERIVFLLTANRLSNPSSELSALEWIKEEAYVEDRDEIDLQHLYRSLDVLLKNKNIIEQNLFKILVSKFNLDTSTVFYDLTSSYFEGTGKDAGNLVLFGYNRDKKKGKKQIVIGLLLIDGIPIYHKVFPGNTTDKTTLKKTIEEMKTKFKLKKIVFVADRGLFTDDNIEWLEKDKENMFIIATKRRRHKEMEELMAEEPKEWETIKLREDSEDKELFVKEIKKENDKRYILCLNKERAKEEKNRLEETKKSLEKKLDKLKKSLKKKKRSEQKLWKNIANILGKNIKLFDIKIKGQSLDYSLNQKNWDYENKIAGRYLLVARNDLPTNMIAKKYRELAEIEEAFREIKSFIKARPDFHKTKERIKGHVFVCVLSFLLSRIAKRYLKDLKMSSKSIFRKLKRLKVSVIKVDEKDVGILDELDYFQKEVLRKLLIKEPYPIL